MTHDKVNEVKKTFDESAEEILAKYYNNDGWDISNGITEDARMGGLEELRKSIFN